MSDDCMAAILGPDLISKSSQRGYSRSLHLVTGVVRNRVGRG